MILRIATGDENYSPPREGCRGGAGVGCREPEEPHPEG